MWMEPTKNGKYKYTERYTDPYTGKYKRVSIVLDKNTKQAQKQAQTALQERIQVSLDKRPDTMTFSDLIDLYRQEQLKTVKTSTYKRNYFACNTLMDILGPDILVSKLNAGYIRKKMIDTGKEPGTLNEHLTRLKALLRWGFRNDYVSDISYLDKIAPFKDRTHREKIENKFMEAEEVFKLISGMRIKKWRDLTEFLVLSGLRFGEAAALRRSDLDFKNRAIHVRENYDSNNRVTTTPKTRTSIRDVYMQDELYDLCKRLYAPTIISIDNSDLLFSDGGDHLQYRAYEKYFCSNTQRLIGRKLTIHSLRHTHASLMMENGMDEQSIARRLGHTNSRITKEIYLHVTKKMQERENQKIKSIRILN